MRVKQIIHESLLLQEQMARFWTLLTYAVKNDGKGIGATTEKALGWLANAVKGKPNAVEELAKGWNMTASKAEVALHEAIKVGRAEAEAAGIAKKVLDEAEVLAYKLYKGKIMPKVRNAAHAAELWYGATLNLWNGVFLALNIGKPIMEMIYYIYIAYEKNEAGNPEYQGNKLQWVVQWEINKCLREVVAAFAGHKIIGWALGPNGIQMLAPFGWGPIGKAFNMLSPAAQAVFQTWFFSDEGKTAFANWLVGKALFYGTDTKVPFGPSFKSVIDSAGQVVAKTGYDAILRALGSDKAGQPERAPEIKPFKSNLDNIDMSTGRRLD